MPLNPVPNWPTSLDSLPDPTNATYEDDDGFEIDLLLQKHNAIAEALEGAVGINESSAQRTPLASTGLFSDTDGKSKWRQAVTADLAANAVTQSGAAVGAATGVTTTSTTYVDLTDMSVTLTAFGGDLLVWFSSAVQNTSGGLVTTALSLDGAAEVGPIVTIPGVASDLNAVTNLRRFAGVSAGSHTVKVRWKVSSGTGSVNGAERSMLVVELKR